MGQILLNSLCDYRKTIAGLTVEVDICRPLHLHGPMGDVYDGHLPRSLLSGVAGSFDES